ncbi:hypothetical protein QA612_20840 [Evansella sp. AB-P1]|uniref:hypothetical protein n=1 Tax=Evansella sp. AB-P1 TaxID=3037653 RepID=UPI00241E8334|nr:hypothetical protein [Evansella sp. AB-P1]MDG5789907.1 hypothetical protein [Evansella sp. AB-P1]
MKNLPSFVHIGELIAISKYFKLNTYQMVNFLENGVMEVFQCKEDFLKKYGKKESFNDLDWVELNNGKIFLKSK